MCSADNPGETPATTYHFCGSVLHNQRSWIPPPCSPHQPGFTATPEVWALNLLKWPKGMAGRECRDGMDSSCVQAVFPPQTDVLPIFSNPFSQGTLLPWPNHQPKSFPGQRVNHLPKTGGAFCQNVIFRRSLRMNTYLFRRTPSIGQVQSKSQGRRGHGLWGACKHHDKHHNISTIARGGGSVLGPWCLWPQWDTKATKRSHPGGVEKSSQTSWMGSHPR